jgi:hypothetical protein
MLHAHEYTPRSRNVHALRGTGSPSGWAPVKTEPAVAEITLLI